MTFTTTEEHSGETVTVELKPGGANVPLTEDNKREYVHYIVEYYLSKRVKEQFEALMSGFNELIPQDLITVFHECELELLIAGMSDVDVYVCPFLCIERIEYIPCRVMTGSVLLIIMVTKRMMMSSNGSGSVCVVGHLNASCDSCNLPLVHHVFPLMVSKNCKDPMGPKNSLSRRLVTCCNCQRIT